MLLHNANICLLSDNAATEWVVVAGGLTLSWPLLCCVSRGGYAYFISAFLKRVNFLFSLSDNPQTSHISTLEHFAISVSDTTHNGCCKPFFSVLSSLLISC